MNLAEFYNLKQSFLPSMELLQDTEIDLFVDKNRYPKSSFENAKHFLIV